ncbi:hypothetical protein B296_00056133, partial [Ensete ventricosum]
RADLTATETMTEYEEQKKTVKNLQECLVDAELQIVEAEKLRKKLHNTILELKGNIRVFCRVRPLLLDNGSSDTDGAVVSYPTSFESLGRGIDLTHNGMTSLLYVLDTTFTLFLFTITMGDIRY